jgi:hypothetical protein
MIELVAVTERLYSYVQNVLGSNLTWKPDI